MTVIEQDIHSTPSILRQTAARVAERAGALAPFFDGPLAFLGCGSSHCIALAAAALYESERGAPGQAIMPSDYIARPGWTHVAISRTGQTTELVEAMRRARDAGARCLLIGGEEGAPATEMADAALPLEFAPEQGVIQTRFISAATLALRLLIGGADARRALSDLPDRVERGLEQFDPAPLVPFEHAVFLGRGWHYGLARSAALNLQETTLLAPEGQQTLDYRHGPIASADERTLVWCLDPRSDEQSAAVIDEVRATGATVRWTDDDPLVSVAQAQLLAARIAAAHGVDPAAPRHLSRAVVLTDAGE